MVLHHAVKADEIVLQQVLDRAWMSAALHIVSAGIDGPGGFRDLAPNQPLVTCFSRPKRDIGIAVGKVDISIADNEIDPQSRMAVMEAINKAGSDDAGKDRLGASEPHGAGKVVLQTENGSLQLCDTLFHVGQGR
nr:hypothetical protein [Mesorhizobium sp.]